KSFAGMFESYPCLKTTEAVFQAIEAIFKSCWSTRVSSYASLEKISGEKISGISIVLQGFIESEKAGVLFTADPVNGSRLTMRISTLYGDGHGVVSGDCDCDEYSVHMTTKIIEKNVSLKSKCYVSSENALKIIDVESEHQSQPVLSDDQIWKLVKLGQKITEL